ncbi:MAG: arylesterase [Chloroflexi bacterium]|nr:arylesterase [Chloroflexota bacterium]
MGHHESRMIVCLGDSLTAGHGAVEGQSYPTFLAQRVPGKVVNAGLAGDTTAGALVRLYDDVISWDPWCVVVELGLNDILAEIPIEETERNLRQILNELRLCGCHVVLAGFPIAEYREMYTRLASASGAILWENFLAGALGQEKLMTDTIHPNEAGYAVIAQNCQAVLWPHLKEHVE